MNNKKLRSRCFGAFLCIDSINDRIGQHFPVKACSDVGAGGKQGERNKQLVCFTIGAQIGIFAFNSYNCIIFWFHYFANQKIG